VIRPFRYRRRNRFRRPARYRPRTANLRVRLLSPTIRQAIITSITRKWCLIALSRLLRRLDQANFRSRALNDRKLRFRKVGRYSGKSSVWKRRSMQLQCRCARARVHLSRLRYFTFSLGVIIGKFNDYVKTLSSAMVISSNNIMRITYHTERRYISVA